MKWDGIQQKKNKWRRKSNDKTKENITANDIIWSNNDRLIPDLLSEIIHYSVVLFLPGQRAASIIFHLNEFHCADDDRAKYQLEPLIGFVENDQRQQ